MALDIDGTLGDYHAHWIGFLGLYFNVRPDEAARWRTFDGTMELYEFLGLDRNDYRAAKVAFRAGGLKRWMPAFRHLRPLMQTIHEMGAEVWVTTTRPWLRHDNIDPDTKEWLARNGVAYYGLLFDDDKYFELTKRVDPERVVMVLEDLTENIDRAQELSLPAVHRRNTWNRGVRLNIEDTPTCATLGDAKLMVIKRITKWKEDNG